MKMEFSDYFIFSCIVLSVHVFACSDNANCIATNGTICNEQGICDCGKCKCKGSYSGPTCEECPTCPSTCDIFKDCVGCKIFGTGPLSPMECIIKCEYIGTFLPVDKSKFDNIPAEDDRILCNNLNEAYCMESFRVGGMRDGYRDLFVRTEEHCDAKYIPTNPPVIEVTLEKTKGEKTGPHDEPADGSKGKPEDVAAVSGSNQDQRVGDNSADTRTLSSYLLLLVAVLTRVLSNTSEM